MSKNAIILCKLNSYEKIWQKLTPMDIKDASGHIGGHSGD